MGRPISEQFESWARHSRNTALSPVTPGPFLARGHLCILGETSLADCELDPFVSDRDQPRINATAVDHIQLVMLRSGSVRLEGAELDECCAAPDLFVRDFARSSRATATRIDAVTLYLARGFLEEVTGPLEAHGMLPISPETTVLRSSLAAIARALPTMKESSAPFYARSLRDLLAAALSGRRSVAQAPSYSDRLVRARQYVATQPPGTVAVDRMVDALGLSRSVLFDMFNRTGA